MRLFIWVLPIMIAGIFLTWLVSFIFIWQPILLPSYTFLNISCPYLFTSSFSAWLAHYIFSSLGIFLILFSYFWVM